MVDYFIEEGGVLPNKLGITDPDALKEVEARVVMIRQLQLGEQPLEGRNVRIAKGDSVFKERSGNSYFSSTIV
jgi:fido (protein-threonine AMPylation protein)